MGTWTVEWEWTRKLKCVEDESTVQGSYIAESGGLNFEGPGLWPERQFNWAQLDKKRQTEKKSIIKRGCRQVFKCRGGLAGRYTFL